ncbi:cytochrome c family protein [Variovorax sp. OV329]|uniref:c-type cytochrome n=1 Tax=Variovorax sp. OV329 TaxID=1882825 RepID=UPI0008F243B8|nr:c-type cytochrome [Variovorax sp. OV329]SFM74828.1 cytochrome c [Variovorax sp. OV329]
MKAGALPLALAALALAAIPAGPAQAQSVGQRLAQSACAQCHSFGKGEPDGVGPNLYGLLGKPAAASPGFNYSKQYVEAMKSKTWDRALLDKWLTDTQAVAPGSTMAYFQDDPKKRAALIEYLQSLH